MERTSLIPQPGERTESGGNERKTQGDYTVTYSVSRAEGFYEFSDGMLEWKEPQEENAHLDVYVYDSQSGRFVPGLNVQATLLDMRGGRAAATHLPFVWDPRENHYGANVKLPDGGARYVLQVHIDPATFARAGKEEGKRYVTGADMTFENVLAQL